MMKHTIPTPRILKPLTQMDFQAWASVPFRNTTTSMCFGKAITGGRDVWFASDDVFFHPTTNISPGSSDVDTNSMTLHANELAIFDIHEKKPTFAGKREGKTVYVYPQEVNGNGHPVMATIRDVRINIDHNRVTTITANYGLFTWEDDSSRKAYRNDGPEFFDLFHIGFDQNTLSWEIPDDRYRANLPADHILNRVPFMNPFRIPFFEDSQDELEYLAEKNG